MSSRRIVVCAVAVFVICFCVEDGVGGNPYRMKRVSDHRLAELETYLALSKIKGQLMTVPIGYGQVDFEKLGRRKREAEQNTENVQTAVIAAQHSIQ